LRSATWRFATAEKFAAYASGGKTRFGPVRPDVNRYLKWALFEAVMRRSRRGAACYHLDHERTI